ncbi:MAG: DUF308 domain-containing protein [Phycisphaeraceae bacterium]|nr:DUF308 domain-containing protein [Phycisphaeraceae bacterium]
MTQTTGTPGAGVAAGNVAAGVRKTSGAAMIFGILLVLAGTVAVMVPQATSIASAMFIGWMLIVGGVLGCAASMGLGGGVRIIAGLLLGLVSIVAGFLMVWDPVTAVLGVSLALGIYFLVAGVMRLPMAMHLRGTGHAGWVLFGAIIDILLGVIVLRRWPIDFWIVGLLVGFQLIFTGWFWIMAGSWVRKAAA